MSDGIDRVEIATAAGNGAAVNLMLALIPAAEMATAQTWPSFGVALEEGRDPVLELGRYICDRPELVSGETVFRKAAELGIHSLGGGDWPEIERVDRLTYDLFAYVTRIVFDRLAPLAVAATADPDPVPIKDTIFETLDGAGERDEHRAAALATSPPKPSKAPKPPKAPAPPPIDPGATPPAPDGGTGAADLPLSIGESPVDPAKQVKRPHGGSRSKKAAAGDA